MYLALNKIKKYVSYENRFADDYDCAFNKFADFGYVFNRSDSTFITFIIFFKYFETTLY